MTTTTAAIWARVSTEEQTVENQISQLKAFAKRQELEIVKIYRVTESGWKGAHLKALSQAYEDGHKLGFTVLLVWALDRLSREGPMATLEIVHRLGDRGIQVISYQEPWTNVKGGLRDVLIAIAGWIAEQESTRRSERTKAGIATARARGAAIGRPSVIQYVDLDFVRHRREEGVPWREVAKIHPHTIPTSKGGFKRPALGTIYAAYSAWKELQFWPGGPGRPLESPTPRTTRKPRRTPSRAFSTGTTLRSPTSAPSSPTPRTGLV